MLFASDTKDEGPNLLPRSKLLDDPVNCSILEALMAEPMIPTSELARRVGMSAPSIRDRMQRLEDAGVIRGRSLDLNAGCLGYDVTVFVRVRPGLGQHAHIVELARNTPNVVECHRVTGDDCFLMKMALADISELEVVIERFLAHGQTSTSVVQSTPVLTRPLPVRGSQGATN